MPTKSSGLLSSPRARNVANWAIILLIAAALIGGGLGLYQSLAAQRRSAIDVAQSFERRTALEELLRSILDAETGQRGFVLTANPAFLQPYVEARRNIPNQLAALRNWRLSRPNDGLDRLIGAKFAEMESTIVLARAGRQGEAAAIVRSQVGRRQMDRIRERITALEVRENERAAVSLADAARIAGRSYALLGLLAAVVLALSIFGLMLAVRTARLETAAQRLAQVEEAERQTRLIARELNHRVKNLFAVVVAIIQLAGRGSTSAADAIARITGRVQALARAHEVSLGKHDVVDLETLLRATLQPYARANAHLELTGPSVRLPVMRVTPLGMIMHELATNAIKYGAWANGQGMVRVSWRCIDPEPCAEATAPIRLCLDWRESGSAVAETQGTKGFGSRMIDSAVAQLGGKLTREWREDGLQLMLDAPIIEAQATSSSRT